VQRRLTEQFAQYHIAPDRLLFRRDVPDPHLLLYHNVDIVLDTLPWGGHTTACEALYMGVPVVTLRGATHAARLVPSTLAHAGLADWIADTRDQYVSIAAALAQNQDALASSRSQLRDRVSRSPLADAPGFTRSFERTLRQGWKIWCSRQSETRPRSR
jgi:predicted O-linked N-acetylglucosamine transferase (SPINDLY family)